MRIMAIFLLVVLGIIYYPLNKFYLFVQKKYLPIRDQDKILFYALAPFYWILVGLVSIISIPYEELSKLAS
jgi:hypothetical protein